MNDIDAVSYKLFRVIAEAFDSHSTKRAMDNDRLKVFVAEGLTIVMERAENDPDYPTEGTIQVSFCTE